jgi:CRP/FNR family transcriptional regulator, cyclic AMP receptor protein
LLAIATLRSCELVEFLDSQRRLPLATRIAQRLLTEVDQSAQSETIECRHEDLAFMLGVSRVAIGKALKRLQMEGLIKLGYGQIHLPDVESLRAKVDDESPLLPLSGI